MRPWTEPRAPKMAVISRERWDQTKSILYSWAIFPSGTEGQGEPEEHRKLVVMVVKTLSSQKENIWTKQGFVS